MRAKIIQLSKNCCHQIFHHCYMFCMTGLKTRWQTGDHFGLFVEILPTRLWGRCVINFDLLVLFSVWISMLSDDVILFSFLIPSLYCDFWRQRLEMIFWIFQIQLCIKVILLGTPAQKQRPKPREGAEKCVQDSLRKASRRLDLFKRPRKEKQVPRRNQPRGWFNKVLPLIWFYISHIQIVMIFFFFPKYM